MLNKRVIFHVDMDCFFASCEQQARPCLRGRPIVVSGKEGSRSVIVASSREAKRLGIKTGMLPFEAKKICQKIIFVEPNSALYEDVSRRFIAILKKHTEMLEVFSIDEAFLDMSGYVRTRGDAIFLVKKIKEQIKNKLGEFITASFGIAKNKLLAKFASDFKKPDGLFFIDETNTQEVLDSAKLTDFCGLGRRLEKHLACLGIDSVSKLREQPLETLKNFFGNFCGQKLYNIARGVDNDPVAPYFASVAAKSVGRSYTLDKNTLNKHDMLALLLYLCEKVGYELRRLELAGRTVVVYWRYADFIHAGARFTFRGPVNDGDEFFRFGAKKILAFRFARPVRLIGVCVNNLAPAKPRQKSLWQKDRKKAALIPFLDKINEHYGEMTIKPALLLNFEKPRKNTGGFRLPE